jgi:hypothetical protein
VKEQVQSNVNKGFYFNILRFSQVLRQTYRWLLEAKLAGIFFLGLVIVPVGLYFWPRENTLKITGCILQAAGMVLAIRGLLRVRIHFDHSHFISFFSPGNQQKPYAEATVVCGRRSGKTDRLAWPDARYRLGDPSRHGSDRPRPPGSVAWPWR